MFYQPWLPFEFGFRRTRPGLGSSGLNGYRRHTGLVLHRLLSGVYRLLMRSEYDWIYHLDFFSGY